MAASRRELIRLRAPCPPRGEPGERAAAIVDVEPIGRVLPIRVDGHSEHDGLGASSARVMITSCASETVVPSLASAAARRRVWAV